MFFCACHYSAAGKVKIINQDSLCIMQAVTPRGRVIMSLICDGMGGEESGETASKAGVDMFQKWFKNRLPFLCTKKKLFEPGNYFLCRKVLVDMKKLIIELNHDLCRYGNEKGIRCGTTLSLIMIFENGDYVTAHVGDSRIYRIKRKGIKRLSYLTKDQTLVAEELSKGLITKEEAVTDKRKNILTECVGISENVNSLFGMGSLNNDNILICSDGFYHELSEEEITLKLGKDFESPEEIKNTLFVSEKLCEERGEKDNISAVLICCRKKDYEKGRKK